MWLQQRLCPAHSLCSNLLPSVHPHPPHQLIRSTMSSYSKDRQHNEERQKVCRTQLLPDPNPRMPDILISAIYGSACPLGRREVHPNCLLAHTRTQGSPPRLKACNVTTRSIPREGSCSLLLPLFCLDYLTTSARMLTYYSPHSSLGPPQPRPPSP